MANYFEPLGKGLSCKVPLSRQSRPTDFALCDNADFPLQ